MPDANTNTGGWGLIAGNGRFPFLVLEGARSQGIDMAVIALKEEASPELEKIAKRLHWVSLGDLSKTIDLMHQEGVKQAVMAGQVKHNKIFSALRPDWEIAKPLVVVKVSKPGQDMRFDVPVVGLPTVEQMKAVGATALAMDAGRTLLFDRSKLIEAADGAGIAMQAFPPLAVQEPNDASMGINKK